MNTHIKNKPDNNGPLSTRPSQPRILFVVDMPNWAHDFKTENLKRVLGNEYEILKCYQSDLTEEDLDQADLILVYYWLQLERLPHLAPAFRRNRNRLLVGVTSNWELEEGRRAPGFALLQEFASAVFVNNLFLYRDCQPVLKTPVFYTPNGVDTRFYQPPVVKQPGSPVRVGWAGSLTNREPGYRGYHDLIVPAVAAVEGTELVTAACEEEWRGPEAMRDFYQSLDVYLCASRTDGTPNPCLEAAACGVPLLTTTVGNMPELVRHGINGFFIERDVEDLKQKLRLLRDNPALRTSLGQRIHEDIQTWDWELRSQAYRQMFEEMLRTARIDSLSMPAAVAGEASVNGHFGNGTKAARVKEALLDRAKKNASLIPRTFVEDQREPEVTIVMLSYGRSEKTLNAIRALRDNVRIPFILLLIDNNSGYEIQKQLEEADSKYDFLELILLKENLGCTRGRMYALPFVKTDYVMFLDNDIEVLPGAVEHLLYTMKLHPEITAATGMAVFPDGLVHVSGGDYWREDGVLYYDLSGNMKAFDDPDVPRSGRCHWINASMTMFQKIVLVEQPFDQSLDYTRRGYYEDLEWSYRLNQAGSGRFERVIESIGIHYHEPVIQGDPVSVEGTRRYGIKYVEGIAYFYKKHGLIIQNLFDFIPEFRQPDQMTLQSVRIFLELVDSRGGEWVLDKWNNDQLAPLFMAPSLADKERAIESLKRDLAEKEQALSSAGGRLLRLYGKIKYRYLLPVYRLLRLMPPEAIVTRKKNGTEN